MADETAQTLPQPGDDPAFKIHQKRLFLNGDAIIVESEEYGTRTRIWLGEPINEKEIGWKWTLELQAEEIGLLQMDLGFAATLAARKANGALAALGQRIGAGDQKIAELQANMRRIAEENDQLQAQILELQGQLAGTDDAPDNAAPETEQPTTH